MLPERANPFRGSAGQPVEKPAELLA